MTTIVKHFFVVARYARWQRGEAEAPIVKGKHEFAPTVRISTRRPQNGVVADGPYWVESEVIFEGSGVECGIVGMQCGCSDAFEHIRPLLDIVRASPDIRDLGGYSPRWGRTRSYVGEMSAEWAGRVWTIRGTRADFSSDNQFRAAQGRLLFLSDRGERFSI